MLMCFAWGMTSGTIVGAVLPWFYFFYMGLLLSHRAARDERRLGIKYGRDYDKYVSIVPYSVIPGVY
jgi:protein-S-isoprenylcysteine O-methyltransferase Ste14